ncbi:glycoside hydrolase [Verrucomicrobia bacterium]|nr:glycoside hydrolase [Verrucomicrobiota bacterium]
MVSTMELSNLQSRRGFLGASACAGFSFGFPWIRAEAVSPLVKLQDIKTISHQPGIYHGWPTLTIQKNGDLLAVCSGGREAHICPFGQVVLMRSRDGGDTWSWPRVIQDSGLDDRDAGILQTRQGTLLATTFTSLAYEPILRRAEQERQWDPARLRRWQAAHARLTGDERLRELGQWIMRSEDGGRTWSGKYPSVVNSPHGPIQLEDGRLLYAGKELWTGGKRVGVCESIDDGKTWNWLAEIPAREGDRASEYHELHALEMPDHRIIVQIRNHNSTHVGETLQSESKDGGRTWSLPSSIGVWGLPSHLLRLMDGRALMSYGYRRSPFGNQARLSEDGSQWSAPLTISSDGASVDLGYPSTVQTPDGILVSLWYELPRGSTTAVLRQARWELEA